MRPKVQIAESKPRTSKNRPCGVTSPYSIAKRGRPLCQAVACHSPLVPFAETPEAKAQYEFDQPLSATRNQRPAFAPEYKPPRASHSRCPDVPASVYSPSANPVDDPAAVLVGIMIPELVSVVSSEMYFQLFAVYATCATAFL